MNTNASTSTANTSTRKMIRRLTAAVYGYKRTFIDTAASFERFETVLETIEGSSEKARQSMDWISDFAVTTPFELDQVTDAFVKLRAYGLDPTQGLLRTLGDTASAMGKPIMQAVDAVTGEWIAPVVQWFVPVEMTSGELAGIAAVGKMVGKVLGTALGGLMRPLSQTLAHAAAGGFSSEALSQPAPAPLPGFPSRAASSPGAASFPSRIDNSIHIQQLTVHQQPGEDAGDLAERLLREIEYRWQVRRRGALYDDL